MLTESDRVVTGKETIMAKSTQADTETVKPMVEAPLPAQLYTRDGKPNPREADVRTAAEATTEAVANGRNVPTFKIEEGTVQAAKATDLMLRRAAKVVGVDVSIRLPQTEPGNVYFWVKPPEGYVPEAAA